MSKNLAILIGLCGAGLIALGVLILVNRRSNAQRRTLYDDMLLALRSVLLPLDFKEKQSKNDIRVSFYRGRLSVIFWRSSRSYKYYRVDGSSKESAEERQARIDDLKARAASLEDKEFLAEMEELENEKNDFSVWGDIIDPKFETNVMTELNKWLFRQGIR